MICKYCGANYTGTKCTACGKSIPLAKRSMELDALMSDSAVNMVAPKTTPAPVAAPKPTDPKIIPKAEMGKTYEQGIQEGYQKGLREGYDNGVRDGERKIVPDNSWKKKVKTMAVACAAVLVIAVTGTGILAYSVGCSNGYESGYEKGKSEGINVSNGEYEEKIKGLEEQLKEHRREIDDLQNKNTKLVQDNRSYYYQMRKSYELYIKGKNKEDDNSRAEDGQLTGLKFPYSKENSGKGENKDIVMKIQEKLSECNYDVGDIDGMYGRKTSEAVKKFQKDKGLKETGDVDEKTYYALFPEEKDQDEDISEENPQTDTSNYVIVKKPGESMSAGRSTKGEDKTGVQQDEGETN